MKIQFVSYGKKEFESKHNITYSTLSKPQSLDAFEINVFSLQNEEIWRNDQVSEGELNLTNDFRSIKQMINSANEATNIILLPQNYLHKWFYSSREYHRRSFLKDEIPNLQDNLLSALIPNNCSNLYDLIYENSLTKINGRSFESAFCFMNKNNILTKSEGSNKATTIQFNKLILTTLNFKLENYDFDDFIKGIGLDDKKTEIPQWLIDYKCFDDVQQQELIDNCNRDIEELKAKIDQANIKIEENLKYKSILSTNVNELVSVVLEMLGKLLVYDFSSFIDEKKEDFLCKLSTITFIGEIKGVTSNVKNEHISQVDVHRQGYFDKLCDEGITENLKTLLIINPFRTKPINEREAIHDTQISLAKRNDCLIITTETLLKIFEKFQLSKISSEKIIATFTSKDGLLTIDSFAD